MLPLLAAEDHVTPEQWDYVNFRCLKQTLAVLRTYGLDTSALDAQLAKRPDLCEQWAKDQARYAVTPAEDNPKQYKGYSCWHCGGPHLGKGCIEV